MVSEEWVFSSVALSASFFFGTSSSHREDAQRLNCLRQGGLRASRDLEGEIRVFSQDRSLSREILPIGGFGREREREPLEREVY